MATISAVPTVAGQTDIPRIGLEAGVDRALGLLRSHGVLIVENALSTAATARIDAELEPWFSAAKCGRGLFFGRATRRFSGVFAKSAATAELAIQPFVLDLVERLLRGDDPERPRCDQVELNLTQAIAIEPGEPGQALHRDEDLWPFDRNFEVMVNVMWTLDPFTAQNGATQVAPGSHLWAKTRLPQPDEVVPATAPSGSAIIWLGGLLHGGGANRSSAIRRGLVISYRLGWLAGAEKLLLSIPPPVAASLPERLQRLIGYQIHKPNLGWVEGRDPLLWLRGETPALAAADDNLTDAQERMLSAALREPRPEDRVA